MLIHIRREDGGEDDVEEALLVKRAGVTAHGESWVEYRLPASDHVVHRSVTATLQPLAQMGTAVGSFI